MSPTRVEIRPHVLHPDNCTVSIYRDNVLVYTHVQRAEQIEDIVKDLRRKGCDICWDNAAGAPYRDWHKSHQEPS
ncbi:hypothetical protein [Anthocerotibacter panamensis]|uniref:hypothetical protein n=1 Tax=Anthocerotibacter panamensis TaxID=2857077 RepID=UPI001C404F63|nr:hypothetical protein [Anthocerotibacter panamensis]